MIPLTPHIDDDVALKHDEDIVAEWTPNRRVFVGSKIFGSILTSICLGAPSSWALTSFVQTYFGDLGILTELVIVVALFVIFVLSCLIYAFIFDDKADWMKVKDTEWILTNQRFIVQSTSEDDYWLSLGDLRRVSRLMWWRLYLRFSGLAVIETAYIHKQHLARRAILAAQRGDFDTATALAEQSYEGST